MCYCLSIYGDVATARTRHQHTAAMISTTATAYSALEEPTGLGCVKMELGDLAVRIIIACAPIPPSIRDRIPNALVREAEVNPRGSRGSLNKEDNVDVKTTVVANGVDPRRVALTAIDPMAIANWILREYEHGFMHWKECLP